MCDVNQVGRAYKLAKYVICTRNKRTVVAVQYLELRNTVDTRYVMYGYYGDFCNFRPLCARPRACCTFFASEINRLSPNNKQYNILLMFPKLYSAIRLKVLMYILILFFSYKKKMYSMKIKVFFFFLRTFHDSIKIIIM